MRGKDPAALRRVLSDWPTPVVFCPQSVGEAILYPADSIEKDYIWAPAHPVVDAYRAYRPMPYDSTTGDMAAAVYAVHPELGFFDAATEGTIQVSDDGKLRFGGATRTQGPDSVHASPELFDDRQPRTHHQRFG